MKFPKLTRFAAAICALAVASPIAALAQQQTITMWTFLDPNKNTGRDRALKSIIDGFEKQNPDIKVRIQPQIYSDISPKFLLANRTGGAPDLVFINAETMGALVKADTLLDLEPYLAKSKNVAADDINVSASWNAALVDGKRLALPLFPATGAIFYRKDLFREAGINQESLKTWADFTAAAKKLTKRDAHGQVWGIGVPLSKLPDGGTTSLFANLLVTKNGRAWDDKTCQPLYANAGGAASASMLIDWIKKDEIMPQEVLISAVDDINEQFHAGRYAMIVASSARYERAYNSAKWGKENLGILPWPSFEGEKYGPQIITGWWAGVWKKSRNKDAAAKFAEYMVSRDGIMAWSAQGGQFPIRTSVINDPALSDPAFAHFKGLETSWANWSYMLPINCNSSRFDADLNEVVHRVLLEGTDTMTALQEAERKFRQKQ